MFQNLSQRLLLKMWSRGLNVMKKINFEDLHELSEEMIYEKKELLNCVSAICKYEIATALISELIRSDIPIGQIDICDYSWNAYDKEYIVSIMDGNIYCNPAFDTKNNSYYGTYADAAFVHQDCNSRLLKYLDCENVYEFSVRDLDEIDETDDTCEREGDDITTYHSDSVTVSRDKFGNPTGFSKSWFSDDGDGVSQYSSYSYYCNDEDILRDMAQDLGVEL